MGLLEVIYEKKKDNIYYISITYIMYFYRHKYISKYPFNKEIRRRIKEHRKWS